MSWLNHLPRRFEVWDYTGCEDPNVPCDMCERPAVGGVYDQECAMPYLFCREHEEGVESRITGWPDPSVSIVPVHGRGGRLVGYAARKGHHTFCSAATRAQCEEIARDIVVDTYMREEWGIEWPLTEALS